MKQNDTIHVKESSIPRPNQPHLYTCIHLYDTHSHDIHMNEAHAAWMTFSLVEKAYTLPFSRVLVSCCCDCY